MAGIQKKVKVIFLFFWTSFIFLFKFFAFSDNFNVKRRGTFFLRTCLFSNKEIKYE